MNGAYSYKDGYREGVLFLFGRNGKVLIEDRGQGFDKEAFFPNGSIEIKDKESEPYILTALFREIKEEFAGKINVKNIVDLGELKVDEISVIFYIYCITDWDGEFPEFIKEEGEPDSRLGMFSVEEARQMVNYDSALEILKRVDNYFVSGHYDG